jgi:hypothetical protein
MGPSVYQATLRKDQLVEDRDGVKAIFAGGNVFHLHIEGRAKHVTVRGTKSAYERAEAERLKLNPEYQPVQPDADSQPTDPALKETDGAQGGESQLAPSDNDDAKGDDQDHDEKPEPEADIPPADGESEKSGDDSGEGEGEGAALDDPDNCVFMGGGTFPVELMDVADVRALLGDFQGRIDGFIGNPTFRRLEARVRATDGCCAPVFFGKHADTDDEEGTIYLVAGLETLGAAINLGMQRVAVVILPHETATASQGPIAAMIYAANVQPMTSDDDMVYRAYQ